MANKPGCLLILYLLKFLLQIPVMWAICSMNSYGMQVKKKKKDRRALFLFILEKMKCWFFKLH